MIAKFKRIYVCHYRDNDSIVAYVEWIDGRGRSGRTEGGLHRFDHPHRTLAPSFGIHMHQLFRAAKRQGLRLERETW